MADGRTSWVSGAVEERFVPVDDDVRVLVRTWRGDPTRAPLVLLDGLGCDGYVWKYVVQRFAGERSLFHVNYRGHGSSDVPRDLSTVNLDTLVRDLSHALDEAGLPPAVFVGHSMGVQVCLESFRFLRKRVRGLALLFGSYQYPIDTWHHAFFKGDAPPLGNRVMRRVFERVTDLGMRRFPQMRGAWKRLVLSEFALNMTLNGELNPDLLDAEDFRPYMDHLADMDMRVFAALARDLAAHSAADVLPTVDVPTLIMGGGRDRFCPLWLSEDMHDLLGDCGGYKEIVRLVLGSHTGPIEEPRIVERALMRLLSRVDG
jgi:pimeloyl-ACP methyl ester carboxylesterase